MNENRNSETGQECINPDKERELFRHKLEIRRVILDKLFLALIIGIFAYFTNMSLENYKSDLSMDRFNREKKLEAILEIRTVYSDMSIRVTNMMRGKTNKDPEYIRSVYGEAMKAIRKWSFYCSPEEIDIFAACLWSYLGLSYVPQQNWKDYDDYFAAVNQSFRSACRSVMGLRDDDKTSFSFAGIPNKPVIKDVQAFLENNFKRWRDSQNEIKP